MARTTLRGELYIGGCGVAEGYLNRPEETAAALIPDPVKAGESRVYRTGDHVVQRADGCLEFMGRGDDQVKIHGYRIELGEIEHCMRRHPAVSGAVAVVYAGPSDTRRLGVCVVARKPGGGDTAAEGEHRRGRPYITRNSSVFQRKFHRARGIISLALYRALRRCERPVPALLFDPAFANVLALEQYRPGPYLGDMLLVRAEPRNPARRRHTRGLDWEGYVYGGLTVRQVPADHGDLFKDPHLAEVAAITLDYLEQRRMPIR